MSPNAIQTGTQSAATSQAPRRASTRRRRSWKAWRGPSAQIGAVATGHTHRSSVIRSSSSSRSAAGATRTVATFWCGARSMQGRLTPPRHALRTSLLALAGQSGARRRRGWPAARRGCRARCRRPDAAPGPPAATGRRRGSSSRRARAAAATAAATPAPSTGRPRCSVRNSLGDPRQRRRRSRRPPPPGPAGRRGAWPVPTASKSPGGALPRRIVTSQAARSRTSMTCTRSAGSPPASTGSPSAAVGSRSGQ